MKKISIFCGCFNEAGNIREFYDRLMKVMGTLSGYDYEIVIADNCSTDGTRDILRQIAGQDKKFKVIMNSRNFGPIRSIYNALLQATGDAVIGIASDLQDPPEVIIDLVKKWEEGYEVVMAVRSKSEGGFFTSLFRKLYYRLLFSISDTGDIIPNFTGFGLYSRKCMNALKRYHDAYPYFRGLISDIGLKRTEVRFAQEPRRHGKTKNNFFTLYDVAMTGFVNHSKLPLRLATFLGFCLALVSFLVALGYLVYKLLYWQAFDLGLAPLVIGLFFFGSVQLIFIGIIGEYVGAILTQVKNHPLVIEDEKINFS